MRKAVLSATMTKLPQGGCELNALNKEAEKIADKTQRNDFITFNMMKVQYHDEVLGEGNRWRPSLDKGSKRFVGPSDLHIRLHSSFSHSGGRCEGKPPPHPSLAPYSSSTAQGTEWSSTTKATTSSRDQARKATLDTQPRIRPLLVRLLRHRLLVQRHHLLPRLPARAKL